MAEEEEEEPTPTPAERDAEGLRPLSERPNGLWELPFREAVEAVKAWFFENFEDPVHHTSYISREGGYQYVWGPYDAREVLEENFDQIAPPNVIERTISEIERDGSEWVPSLLRIDPDPDDIHIPGNDPVPGEHSSSTAELHAEMQAQIRDLQARLAALEQARPPRLHNNPPEAIEDEAIDEPLGLSDRQELGAALETLQSQPVDPGNGAADAQQAAQVVKTKGQKIKAWLAKKRKAVVATAINTVAAEAVKAVWQKYWQDVLQLIVGVGGAVAAWLASFLPF